MAVNRDNVQGDAFSRGFSKKAETYYLFSIATNKEKDFTKALNKLATQSHISSLTKALADWDAIDKQKEADKKAKAKTETEVPVSNALIAFTKAGLDRVSMAISA